MAQRIIETGRGDQGPHVAALAAFLARHGYLEPPRDRGMESGAVPAFDGGVEAAVARYQRLHALPETGVLDAETIRWMNTPRCGRADLLGGRELGAVVGPGSGWGRRAITFNADLAQDVPPLGAATIRQEIEVACGLWAAAGGLTLNAASPGDIFIAFRRGDHGDGHPSLVFDGAPDGTLGHAFPPPHPRLAGQVHLDADEQWFITLPVSGSADLSTLLLHEIGHALGLEHDTVDTSAVMHERFELGGDRRTLSASDIAALKTIYP
jgi:hypothetical protein